MTSASLKSGSGPARRTVVAAAGAAGLTVALTACGGSDDSSSSSGSSASADANGATGSTGSTGSTGGSESASTGGAAAGDALTTTAEIPEGGGKVFEAQKVVVVQPTAGEYKAFSSVCTHAGCAVKSVADGLINCPCHQSNFSITDGSVKSGPAKKPLPEVKIAVSGDSITLA